VTQFEIVTFKLVKAAFANHPYSKQTEHSIVQKLLRDRALSVSLVAELDGVIRGYTVGSLLSFILLYFASSSGP
jgi:hypothetical protein